MPNSVQPPLTAPSPVHSPQSDPAAVEILVHIQDTGDVGGLFGAWVGGSGSGRWIEGFTLAAPGNRVDLEYQAVLQGGILSP